MSQLCDPLSPATGGAPETTANVAVVSFGCRLNAYEAEIIRKLGREAASLADELDSGAVAEQSDVGELHATAGPHRLHHGVGIGRLHADHANFRPHGLDVGRHTLYYAAATDGL